MVLASASPVASALPFTFRMGWMTSDIFSNYILTIVQWLMIRFNWLSMPERMINRSIEELIDEIVERNDSEWRWGWSNVALSSHLVLTLTREVYTMQANDRDVMEAIWVWTLNLPSPNVTIRLNQHGLMFNVLILLLGAFSVIKASAKKYQRWIQSEHHTTYNERPSISLLCLFVRPFTCCLIGPMQLLWLADCMCAIPPWAQSLVAKRIQIHLSHGASLHFINKILHVAPTADLWIASTLSRWFQLHVLFVDWENQNWNQVRLIAQLRWSAL